MPSLDWIEKNVVATHHATAPFRLREPVAAPSCGDGHRDRFRFVMPKARDWSMIRAALA